MRFLAFFFAFLGFGACDDPSIDRGPDDDRRSLILWSTQPGREDLVGFKGGDIRGLASASTLEEQLEKDLGSAVAACSLMFSVDKQSSPDTTYYAINFKGIDLRGELALAASDSFECVRRNVAGYFSAGIGDFHSLNIDTSIFEEYAENAGA